MIETISLGRITSPRSVVVACAAAAVLCLPAPGLAGPIHLSNLTSAAARGARAVIKASRSGRIGPHSSSDDGSFGLSSSIEDSEDSAAGPTSIAGSDEFLMAIVTNSHESGDNPYQGGGFATFSDDQREQEKATLKTADWQSGEPRPGRGDARYEDRRGAGRSSGDSGNSGQSNSGSARVNNGLVSNGPVSVPEPSTLALVGIGLLGAVWMKRRKVSDRS